MVNFFSADFSLHLGRAEKVIVSSARIWMGAGIADLIFVVITTELWVMVRWG